MGFGDGPRPQKMTFEGGGGGGSCPNKLEGKGGAGVGQNSEVEKWTENFSN